MADIQFPEDYPFTAAEFRDQLEGSESGVGADVDGDRWQCDFCSVGVPFAKTVRPTMYYCDRDIVDGQLRNLVGQTDPVLAPFATYCEDCGTRMLLFPCRGYFEVHVQFDLADDGTMRNVEITDASPPDDGIPWSPAELSERVSGVPFEENYLHASAQGKHHWAPQDMITVYLSMGANIDIRELVRWDGSLDPQKLGQARRAYTKARNKIARQSAGNRRSARRKAFRDHVRGNRPDEDS